MIGATGGIGAAMLKALETERAIGLGRRSDPPIDLLDEQSVREAACRLRAQAPFSRIVVATGVLSVYGHGPEKRLADIDFEAMARAFAINAIGPALLIKHFTPLLPVQGR